MAFPTNANQVQAFAGALYGVQIGSITMGQVNSDIAAVGGLNNALNSYYTASFGGLSTATVATTFATNLGLTGAALTAGVAYVEGQLNAVAAGARGAVISNILNLFAGLASDATFGAAATAWNAKVDAAAAYTGSANVAIGTVVTSDIVFALTTSTDTFNGGAGNDTVSGNQLTLGDSDIINGGAGTDTLTFTNTAGSTTYAPASLTGVENLTVTAIGGTATVNAIVASGIETVTSKNSSVDVTVSGLQAAAAVVVDGQSANDVRVFFKDSLAASTTTANVTVKGGAAAAVVAVGGASTNFGTLNLASTGGTANTITSFSGALSGGSDASLAATQINITGDTDLTTNFNLATGTITVDASAFTGKLNLTVDTDVDTLIGGSGNDTFTMAGVPSAATDSVNGGGGTNTMVIDADLTSVTTGNSITNIQILESSEGIADGGSATTAEVKASLVTGLATIKFSGANADTDLGTSGSDLLIKATDLNSSITVDAATTAPNVAQGSLVNATLVGKTETGVNAYTANLKVSTAAIGTVTLDETSASGDYFSALNLTNNKSTGSTITSLVAYGATAITATGTGALTISGVDLVSSAANEAGTSAADREIQTINIDSTGLTGAFTFTTAEANKLGITLGAGVADESTGITNSITLGTTSTDDTVTGTTGALDVVNITEGSSGTAAAPTIVNIDRVAITESSNTQVISLANFTNVGEVSVSGGESITLSNVAEGQVIKTGTRGSSDALSIQTATGVTTAAVTLTGSSAMNSGSGITTNATSFTVTDAMASSSAPIDNNITFVNTHAITALTVVGGGIKTGTTLSTVTLADGTDTGILRSLDFSGYAGHVVMSSLELGNTNSATTVTMASNADANLTVAAATLYRDQLSITGGSGTNTVIATAVGASGTSDLRPAMTGVESLDLTLAQTSEAATTVDLRDTSGLATLKLQVTLSATSGNSFSEDITINNLTNNATLVLSGNTGAYAGDYGVSNTSSSKGITVAAAVSGATTLNVNNTGALAAVSVLGSEADNDGGLVLGSTYTTLNVDLVAAHAVTFDQISGSGLTSMVLENNQNTGTTRTLTVSGINASALTSLTIDSTKGAVTVSDLNTMNSLETLAVNTGVAASGGKTTITAGTSTSIDAITASGTGAFEITALSASSLDSINASGVTGVVTLGSTTTSALTTAAGASIVTGTGNDIVSVNSSTLGTVTLGSVTNSDGVLTDNDTLYLIGAQGSGTGVIDLSQSGDQITTINGQANTTVQSGIDSVNVSQMTSSNSHGWTLTARSAGSAITGSGYNDVINGGAGNDTLVGGAGADTIISNGGVDSITGGTGADTITLGAGVDTLVISNKSDSGYATTAFADGGSVAAADIVYGLASGDKINFAAFATTADGITVTTSVAANLAADTVAIVQGTYDGSTFTAGTASGDNDYLFQVTETTGTDEQMLIVFVDVVGTVSLAYASEIATITIS